MKRVTLTFDNGPDPAVTPRVLDVLEARAIRAHFFVLGRALLDPVCRQIVARAHDAGHAIGNHSFSHETPLGLDPREDLIEREITATEALLRPIAPGPKRFRPFGGGGAIGPHLLRDDVVEHLQREGFSCVLWNSVPRDWVEPETWIDRALEDCARLDHTVLVLHDVPGACLAKLEPFLDQCAARGVEFTLQFPGDCLPIEEGRAAADLSSLTTPRAR